MKLKEINRTAIQAWSPAQHHPVYLAAGTSAQQLDATFSTNASLEIFELDLSDPALAMKSCGVFTSPQRYHKLVWGAHGIDTQGSPSGVLIAGGENGNIILYDPSKIIAGDSEVVIAQSDKHTGPVRALDVNSFQTNLVASGGNESEIYIWDLNSFASPMTPGPKTQPLEDISCVAWNRQVQHILASASPSGRASVWDLRKNDLIIKVSDHSNRMHCSGLAWNPDVATQLVLASEDDRMPVIQMWDLRFATSPLKVLENHTRGVLAIAWSLADPELLLSCGKDNRILCWNPNTAEVLYELPTSTQWCFDIQWCPRNPAVLSAAAFDGHISIYSIMGGSNDVPSATQADQINASFGNMDPFGTGQALPPLQMAQPTTTKSTITPLKKPPKWIRRPVGASFAFGGKLVSLENIQPPPQQPQQRTAHIVHVSQVVTETAFLDRSDKLQATLNAGSFVEFCQTKIEAAQNEFDKTVWSFLKVNFENDARGKYLELLGYKKEELALKISAALEGKIEMSAEVSEPSSAAAPAPEPSPDAETAPAPEPEPPAAAQPELPLEPAAAQPVAQPVPELRPPPPAGSQPPGQPIPEPVLLHDPEPVLDLKTEPDVLAHAEPLADVTPPSDLTPPVDLTSAFDLTPPVELAPPVDLQSMPAFVPSIPEPAPELIPQADHLQSVPLFTPHGGLQQSVSADFDTTSVIQPVPEAAPNVDLLQSVPLFVPPVTLQSFPELAPSTNLQQVFSQQAPPTDAATSMPVLVPPADAQQQSVPVMGLVPTDALQSIPGMDLMPDVNSAPDVLAPVAPQLVPEFLPQVHPPDFPAFMPSVDALQPKTDFDLSALVGTEPMVDLTPLVTPLDLQLEVDLAATVEVQPESQLGLAVEPIVDHATENSLMPAASAGPSAEAFEEEIALVEVEENGPVEDNVASPPEESPAPEETPSAGEAIAPDDTAVPEELPLVEEPLCPAQTPLSVAEAFGLEQTLAPEEFAAPEESPAVLEEPPAPATKTVDLRVSQDIDGLITQALLTGDFESAVDLCLHDNRMADSIILAIAGGPELLEKTQRKYLTKTQSKVSKLISAVVTKDWTEVLETCNLQNWKEALAAVMTYAKPEEFSSLCGLLGSRLEAAEDPALQAQACLCYICAGSVEQLVACWTKAQDSHCPLALQDLVEKVVVLRQAVEQTRGGTAPSVGALLAEKMSQYASLLASQGSLQTAISYLPNNTDQAVVQQLRERLRRALGQEEAVAPAAPAPAAAPAVTPVVTAAAVAQNAQPAVPAATPVQAYASAPAQPQQIPSQPAPAAAAPPTPQYYQQFRSASTVTSWSNQTPTALPSVPRPLGPVPDVQNEPLPPAYGFQPPASAAPPSSSGYLVSQQYQPYPQVQQYMPGAGGPAVFQPLSYSSTAPCFPPQSISSAPVPLYPSPYMNHSAASSYPASPPVFHGPPPVGQPSASAPLPTPLSASNFSPPSLSSGVTFQHGGPGSPTSYLPPPPLGPSGPQNGWNDPPSLSRVPKKKKVPDHFTPPAPITAPIMAPLGEPQAQPVPMQPPQQFPGQPGGPAPFSPIQQQPLNPLDTNPAMPKMNVEGAPGAPIGDVIQPVQSLPAEKITKKPIPDEHLILKTTFEGLIQKCLAAAADPQTKRKLDDANKRLDFLYDKLRDQTLSPAIVTGLHNIAHSIETRSYMEGLSMHTHIVSNSNFSETSAFMPVLKVVLTQANKLGV